MLSSNEAIERKKDLAKDLATIVRTPVDPEAPTVAVPVKAQDQRFDTPYGRLAEELHGQLVAQGRVSGDKRLAEVAEKETVIHGLYLTTKLLSRAPKAYADYLKIQRDESRASVVEVGDIARNSLPLFRLFTDHTSKAAYIYEFNFGLLNFPPLYEKSPFIIVPSKQNSALTLAPSPLTHARTILDASAYAEMDPDRYAKKSHSGCPAVGIVLKTMTERAIDQCVARPELFQADLTAALAEPTPTQL